MGKERIYEGSTEFNLWVRNHPELDKTLGYMGTDIDLMHFNSIDDKWMILEEKRYGWWVKPAQHLMLGVLNRACARGDKNYRGLHQLVFENTNPEDGKIQVNNKDISKEDLIKFLKFDEDIIKKYYQESDIIYQKLTPKIVDNVKKL